MSMTARSMIRSSAMWTGFDTCLGCHDQHTLQVRVDKCAECHEGVKTVDDLKNNRENGSLVDYNGNGDTKEGIFYEIKGLQDMLYGSIQMYAKEVAGVGIVYDPATNPYWFADADGDGKADQKDGKPVTYSDLDCPPAEGRLQLPGLRQGSRRFCSQCQVHHRAALRLDR